MRESGQLASAGDNGGRPCAGLGCGEYLLGDIPRSELDVGKTDGPNMGEVGADLRLYVAEGGEREERVDGGGGVFEIRWVKPSFSPLKA